MKRMILEMGMGLDVHGGDYNKAAQRAIHDAIRHSSLNLFKSLDLDSTKMEVRVTIGVQKPEALDCELLALELPRGMATVKAEFGGQDVTQGDSEPPHIIATAAIEAYYPIDPEEWTLSE
ncbi:MAG: Lin0512 family protein [Pseudomonadota bacterium]